MTTRREFMVGAAGVLAATALPLSAQTTAPAPDRKLGWAIVGIGKLSQGEILPALYNCKKSRLAAIVTGHAAEKAPPILSKFGLDQSCVYNYDNYDKLADNPDVDCIYIVLPNGMHAEYTIRGLKAGKHVLCEKPMANSPAECQQMIDASKATGKKLMVAYRIRREPYNMKAIEMCKNQTYGKPRLIITDHSFNIPKGAWRTNLKLAGGGSLVDVGIYGLNATRYLTGEEPVSVTAQLTENSTDPRFTEIEEGMTWTMKFPSGTMATCTTSYNAIGTNRQRIICEHGYIDMEPATGYHGIKMTGYKGHDKEPFTLPDIDQFVAQMDYFSDCVTTGAEPITTGEEGLKDMTIMAAIYQSAREGRTVTLA